MKYVIIVVLISGYAANCQEKIMLPTISMVAVPDTFMRNYAYQNYSDSAIHIVGDTQVVLKYIFTLVQKKDQELRETDEKYLTAVRLLNFLNTVPMQIPPAKKKQFDKLVREYRKTF